MKHSVRSTIDAFTHYLGDLSGRPTQSIRFPKKLIYYYLSIFRNAVLYEEFQKRADIDLTLEQTIPCIELKPVDVASDCPCAPEKGCKWLKSIELIPDLLKPIPNTVITVDGGVKFEYEPWYDIQHVICSRYKGVRENPYYTFRNVDGKFHLYIYANSNLTKTTKLKRVAMSAIFKDPLDVIEFPVCGRRKNKCNVLDQDFLIPLELESVVFMRTYNALMSINRFMPKGDFLNNDNNDSAAQVPL